MVTEKQASGVKKRLALHTKIFIGLTVGIVAGLICNATLSDSPQLDWTIRNLISPIGQVFLRMIFMAVIPLIFAALTLGVAELGDLRRLGRIGGKTFAFTLLVTAMSVVIGVTLVNVFRPGEGLDEANRQVLISTLKTQAVQSNVQKAAEAKSLVQTLLDIIPRNPLADAVGAFDENYRGGGILAVMFFSLILGVALALTKSDRTDVFERAMSNLTWHLQDNAQWNRIAATAQVLEEMRAFGGAYAKQVIANGKALGAQLDRWGFPVKFAALGYTGSHQLHVDVGKVQEAFGVAPHAYADLLERNNLIVDAVGRIGTNEVTRMGAKEEDMQLIAGLIVRALRGEDVRSEVAEVRAGLRLSYVFP